MRRTPQSPQQSTPPLQAPPAGDETPVPGQTCAWCTRSGGSMVFRFGDWFHKWCQIMAPYTPGPVGVGARAEATVERIREAGAEVAAV